MTRFKSMTEEEFRTLYEFFPAKKLSRVLGYVDKEGKFHPFEMRSIYQRRRKYEIPPKKNNKENIGRPRIDLSWKDKSENEQFGKIRSLVEKVRRDEYKEDAGDVMEYITDVAYNRAKK